MGRIDYVYPKVIREVKAVNDKGGGREEKKGKEGIMINNLQEPKYSDDWISKNPVISIKQEIVSGKGKGKEGGDRNIYRWMVKITEFGGKQTEYTFNEFEEVGRFLNYFLSLIKNSGISFD